VITYIQRVLLKKLPSFCHGCHQILINFENSFTITLSNKSTQIDVVAAIVMVGVVICCVQQTGYISNIQPLYLGQPSLPSLRGR